jgi:hypothetical protein
VFVACFSVITATRTLDWQDKKLRRKRQDSRLSCRHSILYNFVHTRRPSAALRACCVSYFVQGLTIIVAVFMLRRFFLDAAN